MTGTTRRGSHQLDSQARSELLTRFRRSPLRRSLVLRHWPRSCNATAPAEAHPHQSRHVVLVIHRGKNTVSNAPSQMYPADLPRHLQPGTVRRPSKVSLYPRPPTTARIPDALFERDEEKCSVLASSGRRGCRHARADTRVKCPENPPTACIWGTGSARLTRHSWDYEYGLCAARSPCATRMETRSASLDRLRLL